MNKLHAKTKQRRSLPGFSLIELMAVITIMAVLGGAALPGVKLAMVNAQQARAMSNARGIGFGLISYAQDYDGIFPSVNEEGKPFQSSNEVFRLLLPEYVDTESVFSVRRSSWGTVADGRIDKEEDRLKAGENHFAYISGLMDSSRTDWPLIVDGTNGSGTYKSEYGTKGGCWEGRKAVVVKVGGSASVVRLRGDEDKRYIPRYGYPEENALDVDAYMGSSAQLLDPE